MLQPSLQTEFDTKCDICKSRIEGGSVAFNMHVGYHPNEEPIFATCCSKACSMHAIEDSKEEEELYSRHAGR